MKTTESGFKIYENDDLVDFNDYTKSTSEALENKLKEKQLEIEKNKESITALQSDTKTNKESIDDINTKIKTNETNRDTDIKRLEELIPTGQATGESVSLTDSAEYKLIRFSPIGKTEQATRSGKNKFDINKILIGEIDSNGDLKIVHGRRIFYEYDFKENTQYTLSAYVKNENTTGYVRFYIAYTDGTDNASVLSNSTTEYKYMTFTTEPNKTVDYIGVTYGNGGAMYIKGAELQIEEGTVATPYEQYGAMPSPDYPSEVRGCGDNINIFDSEDWYNILHAINSESMTKEVVDGIEYYKFCPEGIYDYQYMKGCFEENTQYTISMKTRFYDDTDYTSTGFIFRYTDGTSTYHYINPTLNEYDYKITTEPSKTIDYIKLSFNYNRYVLAREIKLEKGSKATPYSQFGQGNISIIKAKHNILKPTWAQDLLNRLNISSTDTTNCITEIDGHRYLKYNANLGYGTGLEYFAKGCFKENTQYTFKTMIMRNVDNVSSNIQFVYTDGTISEAYLSSSANMTRLEYKFTSLPNKTVKYIGVRYSGGTTYIDLDQIMLYEGTEDLEWEDYAKDYIVPTQKPFYEGDTFVKQEDKWYEKHLCGKIILDGTENWGITYNSGTSSNCFWFKRPNLTYGNKICTHFKYERKNWDASSINTLAENDKDNLAILFNISKDIANTLDEWKAFLAEKYASGTPVYVVFKLAEPELIPCTQEQNEILDKIEEDGTYKNITYFYSEDEIKPILDIAYYKDIETEHNKLQTQIDEIKALLSTTATSALLLDNMQTDLESEV